MSTPFDSIRSLFRPTTTAPTSLQGADTALKKMDTALDTSSKVADTFMKEGIPKMTTGLFLSKMGIVGSFVSTARAYQEGDASAMFAGGAKIVGAMGTGPLANVADGINNGVDLIKGLDQGDMQKVTFAGAKLCLNLAAGGSAPAMLLLGASEFAFDAIKNNPDGFRLHNQETQRMMRGGVDDNYIGA
ncbi:hypothetical protein LMG3458_04017 [Achromobacter deleyi]|uniref:Uncharacterized protein n=1 Tax=Achromobacter deleyi TaxID=1353891 RepID=A0A6S7B897_9BURK|nr:hypothetical protein [Achromobacter deleyi]CAB3721646.1 hypothetical protein LMG3458_04017 [Achromobacter deleyi]CAB3894190.1 hypothetical protein LMG3482_03959 [Achromobacter deleyi]CAB3917360.1 hypothetical protein LMG3481_05118 [Achromobacter deleyi]